MQCKNFEQCIDNSIIGNCRCSCLKADNAAYNMPPSELCEDCPYKKLCFYDEPTGGSTGFTIKFIALLPGKITKIFLINQISSSD